MASWGSGYVTDVEYLEGFYGDQSPSLVALAATFNGLESLPLEGHFTYCELGCGRGKVSLVLAAVHPEAEFHAVDFNPAHIAHARRKAQHCGLRNVFFHERSFEELTGARGTGLPSFDAVTMHGVWTWIAPQLQTAILDFINHRLNPGGLVYVSYNALPGWSQAAPLQRLIRELATCAPQRSDVAVQRAIEQLMRLAEAHVIPARFGDGMERFKDAAATGASYLAHEYLNEHWRPVYFADVARAFAGAKLDFAASADLLRNFYNLSLNQEQHALISAISSAELRETLKDFCADNWFRRDVFVRGASRMSDRRRIDILSAKRLMLMRPPPEIFEIAKADRTRWRPDPEVYRTITRALERRPHSVAELLQLAELPADHAVSPVELVGTLIGTGVAGLYAEPNPAAIAAADRLNEMLGEDDGYSNGSVLAVPSAHTGISLTAANHALYRAVREGATPSADQLAVLFIQQCRDRGTHPQVDGKLLDDDVEARAAVTRDYQAKLDRLVPLWRLMGICA